MPCGFSDDVESCATKEFGIMTLTEAIDTIIKRTKSLERLLVHKNPVSWAESERVGIEDEFDGPAELKADFRRRQRLGKLEYELEDVVLKHRQIIAMVNRRLNNLFRYTLEARLRILNEHRQEFQIDIKTIEEYLFLLRKLELVHGESWAQKISIASQLMSDSIIMHTSIETRIQEAEDFLSEASTGKLSLGIRTQMMIDLGVRHGTYGSTLVSLSFIFGDLSGTYRLLNTLLTLSLPQCLRDHEKYPQWNYRELIDVKSLQEQSGGTIVASRKSGL
ncbi:hypothetical protein OCU04_005013 [Sclerotinia nivalis]|uniref:Uncharacterized protein n=1 Tax=Sclerotinia nivalis TaxID=352851 RepID=A0A9X0DK53_9HELO|nr:hypothetical protein OCU04_005013 [Sclerotinia nivalis]